MTAAEAIEQIHRALGEGDGETARALFDQVRNEHPDQAQAVADALAGGSR